MVVRATADSNSPERPGQVLIVLLPDAETGTVGRATVSNPSGTTDLAAARESTTASANQPPAPVMVMSEAEVQTLFGAALSALPPASRRFTLYFRFDSDELTDESRALVPEILQAVRDQPAPDVVVVGHTDTTGSSAFNFELGLKRANAVRNILVEAGLDAPSVEVTTHRRGRPAGSHGRRGTRAAQPSRRNRRPMIARSRTLVGLTGLVPAIIVALLSLYRPPFLANLEYSTYDTLLRMTRATPPDTRIVIVDVDERSLSAIGQWPWRRDIVGDLVNRLRDLGASTVALDIIFAESDRYEGTGASTDASLADTLRSGRVVVGYALTFDAAARGANACVQHPIGLAIIRTWRRGGGRSLLSSHRCDLQPADPDEGRRRLRVSERGTRS